MSNARRRGPLVVLPTWTRTTTTALLLVLLIVPAIVGRPFARLGAEDASGSRQYRAYFIADFVWHMAVTAELAKHEPRPLNPFLSGQPLHYYWTYFRVPATVADQTSLGIAEVLKLNALFTALCLMAAIFLAAWAAVPDWPLTVALAVALTTLAASAEGIAGIADILRRGLPLAELRDLNIDAIAAWAFKGLRIDNLPRTMWYTPQHGFSCALGLLSVPVALAAGARARPMAIALAGCALGASIAFNPLLGAVFCAVYGITVLVDTWTTRATISALFMHAIAVVPVAVGARVVYVEPGRRRRQRGAALRLLGPRAQRHDPGLPAAVRSNPDSHGPGIPAGHGLCPGRPALRQRPASSLRFS